MPAIVRVKTKSLVIVVVTSTMIVGLPLIAGFFRRLVAKADDGRAWDRASAFVALAFVAATLANIADVTQVAQLGRYYLPVFVLMVPPCVAGLASWLGSRTGSGARPLLAASLVALLWADPSWSYDFTWLGKSYQLHWPALMKAGEWVREHPVEVPPDSRIMTWFPWEFRLASRRTTILMNRSLMPFYLDQTVRQYGVTHVLWGSLEPPPEVDPELWGPNLAAIRRRIGLTADRALYSSPGPSPFEYPVTLYRLGRGPS